MSKLLQVYAFLGCLLVAAPVMAQGPTKRIKYEADEIYEIRKDQVRRLLGNVKFTQENTTVYCDSTYFFYRRNYLEGFGNVRIVDDSTTITSKKLIYEGDERMSRLRTDVVYVRGERRLYTDFLDYHLDNEVANYFNKGKLIDTTNVLTSEIGYFYAKENYAIFYKNVVLEAPDFTLKADTLRYNTITKVAYTYGKTEITSENGTVLHAQGGEFRTVVDQSEFEEGIVETEDYTLEGDRLYFDDFNKYYRAIRNVVLTAKEKDVIITGEEGFYDKASGLSKIYGNPLMKRILEADTFYLRADTLVALESEFDSLKRILAYHNVLLYKKGLQGKADSMAYFQADSNIFFYRKPVMWNNDNQVTADTLSLSIKNDQVDKMYMRTNAFLISEDTILNYNQIKGRQMVAHFVSNEIDHMDVNGNGEILYFALEGDSILMGMNKVFCARMGVYFKDQQLSTFRVYNKPEAKFIPPHELGDSDRQLEGFAWQVALRPELYDLAPYLSPDYDAATWKPKSWTAPADSAAAPVREDTRPSMRPATLEPSKGRLDPAARRANPPANLNRRPDDQ